MANRRGTVRRHVDGRECAVGVVFEFLDANGTGVTAAAGQGVVMIKEIRMSLVIYQAGMIRGTVALGGNDHAFESPWPGGVGAGGVANVFGKAAGRIHHVIQTIPLAKPRAFLVESVARTPTATVAAAEALNGQRHLHHAFVADGGVEGNHVLIQFDIEQMRIAPIHIGLAVIINEDRRVNVALSRRHQPMAERIVKRAGRAVRHRHADGPAAFFWVTGT